MEQNNTTKQPLLAHPFMQLFIYLFIFSLSLILVFGIGSFLCSQYLPNVSFPKFTSDFSLQKNYPVFALSIQGLMNLGAFGIPALLFALVTRKNPMAFLNMNNLPNLRLFLFAISGFVALMIFSNFLIEFSSSIKLPDAIKFMRQSQSQQEEFFQTIFSKSSLQLLPIYLFILAFIPAISEELFFRAILQRSLFSYTYSAYFSIIVSGLVFAFAHSHFDNFLAIWLMGIFLGATFHYTQSFWANFSLHFFNNAATVILYYLAQTGVINKDFSENISLPIWVTIIAIAIVFFSLHKLKNENSIN